MKIVASFEAEMCKKVFDTPPPWYLGDDSDLNERDRVFANMISNQMMETSAASARAQATLTALKVFHQKAEADADSTLMRKSST